MNALDMSASMGTVFSRMSTMRTDGTSPDDGIRGRLPVLLGDRLGGTAGRDVHPGTGQAGPTGPSSMGPPRGHPNPAAARPSTGRSWCRRAPPPLLVGD